MIISSSLLERAHFSEFGHSLEQIVVPIIPAIINCWPSCITIKLELVYYKKEIPSITYTCIPSLMQSLPEITTNHVADWGSLLMSVACPIKGKWKGGLGPTSPQFPVLLLYESIVTWEPRGLCQARRPGNRTPGPSLADK